MKKIFLATAILCCITGAGLCVDNVKQDGMVVWTSDFDSFSPATGYQILQWTWKESDDTWYLERQIVNPPEILGDDTYAGNVYDMAMDIIKLKGMSTYYAVMLVSMGTSHFPSAGTEFQLRKLSADGVWDAVQAPLFTTPADVSPLGVDIYYSGDELHLAWMEDNDEAGPKSLMCEIYDQVFTVNADGTLTAKGNKTLVFSTKLNWGGSYPTAGGAAGLTVCDFDGDGDLDFIVGTAHYVSGETAKMAIRLIERLGANQWATEFKNLWVGEPGHGAEGVRYANIDGDNVLDLIITSGNSYAWSVVVWMEKEGDAVVERDALIDTNGELELLGEEGSVGHIFGLYAEVPGTTEILDWSVLQ